MSRGDPHPTKCCPRHERQLLETRDGKQLTCPTYECSYYERTDVELAVKVRR